MTPTSPRTTGEDNGRRHAFGVRSAVDTANRAMAAQKPMTDRSDANMTNVNGNPRISPVD